MTDLKWQAALLRDLYEHDKASGEFDPRTLLSRELSAWDRGIAELGRGLGQGLTLGFVDKFNDESLDVNPGHFDWTDALNLTGNVLGTLPAAVVTGGLAAAGGRAVAPQLAARAGLLGMLGRGVAFAAAEAPEGASLGMRMLHGAAANVLEGAPLNAVEVGRQVAQEDEFDPERIAVTSGANLLADVVFGAGFGGLRRAGGKRAPASGDELVDVPPDVEATVQTTGQGATPASLGFEEPRGPLLLPPGRPGTPAGAIPMGPPAPPPPDWLVNLERNAWYPPQESSATAPEWLRTIESAPYRYPRRFRDGSLGVNPSATEAPAPPILDAEVLGFEEPPTPDPAFAGALPRRPSLALPPGAEGTPEGVFVPEPPAGSVPPGAEGTPEGVFVPEPPAGSVPPAPAQGPVERTFRRVSTSSPPPAHVTEPVPVDPALAAQAAGRRTPVLNPQEAQVAGLGFDEPITEAAPAASLGDGVPQAPPPAAAAVVDERVFRSREARGLAQAANAAGGDKLQLFGLLANLSDPNVLRNSPEEKAALQRAIAARMAELPDPVRPGRVAPAPAPREETPDRPTNAAPAPAAGGKDEVHTATDDEAAPTVDPRIFHLNPDDPTKYRTTPAAYAWLDSLEPGWVVHTPDGDFTFNGQNLVNGRTRVRVRTKEGQLSPDERAIAFGRHKDTRAEEPIPPGEEDFDVPDWIADEPYQPLPHAVEALGYDRIPRTQDVEAEVRNHFARARELEERIPTIRSARKQNEATAEINRQLKLGQAKLEQYEDIFGRAAREAMQVRLRPTPEPAAAITGPAPDGPTNLFGEHEQPNVEQAGLFRNRDFAAGDRAAADRISGRKMSTDEVLRNTRSEGRESLEGGERGLFDSAEDDPYLPDLDGSGGAPATAVLSPPKKRTARGITPARPDHVDTPPEGAADNVVYHKVREAARAVSDDELRARYLRNLRQNIDAGSDAEARPSRTRRIDREDRDVPIYKPVSAGAERSRWNRTNSEARLAAYANELRARGLEEPHPDDAFRDVQPEDVPERLHPLLQEVREAETADELRTMLYAAERRAMRDPHAVVDRAVIAGEMRARGIPTSTREMVDAGDFTGALYAKVLPNGPGIGAELRAVLESHIQGAADLSDRELVQRAVRERVVDNPSYRTAVSVLDDYGFWRISGRLAFDPLIGAAAGMFGGGIVGGRIDKDNPMRGALAGATAGAFIGAGVASGGALASRVLREARLAGEAREVNLARGFRDELRDAAARGEMPRVSMDDSRLRLETPRARRRRNPGSIGFPLRNQPAEPQHAGGGFWRVLQNERGAWDLTPEEVDAVAEPRVQLEDRPRGLGIVETWLRSPRDLFAKYDPHAAEVADLAARALDEKKRFLDLRRVQVQTAMSGLTRADKRELWRALDKYSVVSDVPMQVGKRVREAFVSMRRLFRDDVVRLFEMRRDFLTDADRKTLDQALAGGTRESSLPPDFPEHLRPLVAMKTGEWGIAAYWPHVFDGNWKVHAGEHTNYFNTRNEAETYAQRLLRDGKWADDIPVTYMLAVTGDMAAALPRDRYFRLVDQLRGSLGLNRGSIVSRIDGTVRVGAPKRFLAHERQRAVDLQTFIHDPEKALDLYYHRWASKLAFDPFRVRSSELLGKVDKRVVGLVDEVDDYIRRVQGLPGKNELAFDHTVQRSLLWLTHGLLETKPFRARRAASRITEAMAFAKLGFSPVSAVLNLTQTIINTAPHVGEKWAVRGARDAADYFVSRLRGTVDPEVEAVLRDAGALTLDPKHLLGDSGAQRLTSLWAKTRYASMYMFDAAERTNRVIAALAAFRKAQADGLDRAAAVEYAREVQRKTQFRYDAADAPKLATGPLGKVVGQFQVYALKELEFMGDLARRDPKAFARAVGYFAGLTGVRGLMVGTPLWALDALAGKLGIMGDEDGVQERPSEWAAERLPGPLVFGAVGTLLGSDVSERMGAGTARDFTVGKEGPAIGTLLDLYRARQAWASGDTDRAAYFLKRTAPTFASRLLTAFEMYETQETRDSWGRTVRPASGADVVRTGLGIRGWEATREWDRESIRRRDQDARANTANRARNRVFDALDNGDVDAAYEALRQAQDEGAPLSVEQVKSAYMERRNPQLRAIRRTRGADRNRLLGAGILERP